MPAAHAGTRVIDAFPELCVLLGGSVSAALSEPVGAGVVPLPLPLAPVLALALPVDVAAAVPSTILIVALMTASTLPNQRP
jgi:hypothetical protein